MAFAYGQLSLLLHNPGPVHMAAAERALAYVRGTPRLLTSLLFLVSPSRLFSFL